MKPWSGRVPCPSSFRQGSPISPLRAVIKKKRTSLYIPGTYIYIYIYYTTLGVNVRTVWLVLLVTNDPYIYVQQTRKNETGTHRAV